MLELQRTVGNRAATALVLQREPALVEVPPPPAAPTAADPHADPGFQQVKGRISSHGRATKRAPAGVGGGEEGARGGGPAGE